MTNPFDAASRDARPEHPRNPMPHELSRSIPSECLTRARVLLPPFLADKLLD